MEEMFSNRGHKKLNTFRANEKPYTLSYLANLFTYQNRFSLLHFSLLRSPRIIFKVIKEIQAQGKLIIIFKMVSQLLMGLLYWKKKKHTLHSKLERRKLLIDILLCLQSLQKIWLSDFLSQRKSCVELVKYISQRSVIDVGFFSCLTLTRLKNTMIT